MLDWFENSICILNAYQAHQTGENQLRMSSRAWQMAMGFKLAAGAETPSELARLTGVSKAALGKTLNHFIEMLNLTPLPGQRNQAARENMAKARCAQLSPNVGPMGTGKSKRPKRG